MARALPRFIPPMLAVRGRPFDSDEHFFEFKWDGYRAGAYIEGGRLRLMSRTGIDITADYPTLRSFGALPSGLALDGELVAFVDGRPNFEAMQGARRGRGSSVRYVVFDILYSGYADLAERPFSERRRRLEEVIASAREPLLVLSEGLAFKGKELYSKAVELDLEGVMAKRLASSYSAGKRSDSWVKFKRRKLAQVAIIGFLEKGRSDFQCLLVAANGLDPSDGDGLRYIGRVGGGFTDAMRDRLNGLLRRHPRGEALVPCPENGSWIEPGLYCTVSYAERTSRGLLRSPVFEALIDGR